MRGEQKEKSPATEEKKSSETKIVKTDVDSKDGRNKCPKCGSTEIVTSIKTGKLKCVYCRFEFEPEYIEGMVNDISTLKGEVIGSGASDIIADAKDVVTFKCDSCGAEVVVDTASAPHARCHWCRHVFSVNQQIPNGSIPDVVLPFGVEKDAARLEIEKFVGKRKFYAHPTFRKEFTTANIMGVYFPYMIIDVNGHANFAGEGEILKRRYTRGSGNNQTTYYDADMYKVEREFDVTIEGLSIESNSTRLNNTSSTQTNNIINAIMPFDVENCVKYNANYLRGYTSEKRDVNISDLKETVNNQAKDVAKFAANESLTQYDRGVAWSTEELKVKGQQWKAAYLPVWLYSYQQDEKGKKLLHYVAVNARTKETMGSVPIHMPKLLTISALVELLGIILMLLISSDEDFRYVLLLSGFIYFIIIYSRYRNSGARHKFEVDTKSNITNLRQVDDFVEERTGLTNSMISGYNNKKVTGSNTLKKDFDEEHKVEKGIINDQTIKNIKENIEKIGGNK